MLQLRGYETVAAHDGLDALAQLRDGLRSSLILLDWMMPNLDGRGFLEKVAADGNLKSIPVVIYSAVGGRFLARDVAATLPKSADPEMLLDVVARFAERYRRDGP